MKKLILFLSVILLCACTKENKYSTEEKFSEKMSSASSDIILVDDMPNWLQVKIDDIEKTPLAEAKVYMCEWREQTLYYVWSNFNSCIYCDVYGKDGIKVIWKDDKMIDEFVSTSKNWKMIWSFCDCDWKNN